MKLINSEKTLALAAARAGMDEKTARKYRAAERSPSQLAQPHDWRTRTDAFDEVWPQVQEQLKTNPGLEAKSLFEWFQRRAPGRFADGQLRTFQRRVKHWRATQGPPREVMFPQQHLPGRLAQSDFTHLDGLDVTIAGELFPHMIYHFVLTYSNWETGTICYSESFESLAEGLQNALWELGGVPAMHQTDNLSAALKRESPEIFTARWKALLAHYRLEGAHTQPASPNENGDIEQRHHRFKRALEQSLLLRGGRDFATLPDYDKFLRALLAQLNAGRVARFQEELALLGRLPPRRLDDWQRLDAVVGPHSTISLQGNVYSVHSRLIGEQVQARLRPDTVEIWYGAACVETLARLRGRGRHGVNYRHVIDWLVRKPGAFERYLYREELFPTSRFRLAYDMLVAADPERGHKQYLAILQLAASENETAVDECLRRMIDRQEPIAVGAVAAAVKARPTLSPPREIRVDPVDLGLYDALCPGWAWCAEEVAACL
jgi:hypothetical protein